MLSLKHAAAAAALLLAGTIIAAAQTGETPAAIQGAKTVTAAEAKSLMDKGSIVLDVRAAKAFGEGHLPKAKSIRAAYNDKTKEFDPASFGTNKDAVILIYGHGSDGWTAVDATKSAVKAGFKQVYWMSGGWAEWTKAGLPVEK
jgi:rhodanese-related sulfurtransferase